MEEEGEWLMWLLWSASRPLQQQQQLVWGQLTLAEARLIQQQALGGKQETKFAQTAGDGGSTGAGLF